MTRVTFFLAAALVPLALGTQSALSDDARDLETSRVGEGTIAKVIKIMKEILEKSKEDGMKDRELFAKFKCYCDTNEEEKKKSVEDLTKEITMLSSEIGELQADTGKRSIENGELAPLIAENEEARETAQTIRGKENDSYHAEEEDLIAAIGQMKDAIETLSAVGADQTANTNAAHEKFMAGAPSLVKLSSKVKQALKAASMFAPKAGKRKITAFIQAPFGGTYTSQSVEIVGILKNMKDTFEANLKTATDSEAAAAESQEQVAKVKTDNYSTMKATYETNENILASNDDAVTSKKEAKATAESTLAEDQAFLAKLIPMCEATQKNYEDRKMTRASEDSAVTQAIGVLNTDAAVDSFGKTKATSEGATGFLQVGSAHSKHAHGTGAKAARARANQKLQKAAIKSKSLRLARVAMLLETGSPFDIVTKSIGDMIKIIEEEEKADDEQKSWCDSERENSDASIVEKADSITTLTADIETLDDTVNNVETGLKQQLKQANEDLKINRADQKTEIEERKETNKLYQSEMLNLIEAETTLKKATAILKKFYKWLKQKQGPHHYEQKERKDSGGHNIKQLKEVTVDELEKACTEDPNCAGFNTAGYLKDGIQAEDKWYDTDESLYVKVYDESLLQTSATVQKEDPAPPAVWEEDSKAGDSGKGTDVVSMLEFITQETIDEENEVHMGEEASQHEFEDDMDTLKATEKETMGHITNLEEEIAQKESTIEKKYNDKFQTENEHKSLERYLEKIKPGCDFITENIETRKENRAAEIDALNNAVDQLKGSPAYLSAKAEDEQKALGECADRCDDKEDVACVACLSGVTVSGYCSGHPKTPGC